MLPRCFILFGFLALLAFVQCDVSTNEVELEAQNEEVVLRNPALRIAVAVLKAAFKWAAKHCLEEAANNCKQHWKHPKELVNCARGFLQANKGRCAAGGK